MWTPSPQLTFEVTYDRVVRARLAHHFHLSGPAMCAYVQDNLVLKHLTKPFRTRVYCISPRGREYYVVMTLKRGSEVFAMRRTGQPILRLVCGNPLVAALPPTPAKKAAAARPPVSQVKPATLAKAAPPTAPVSPASRRAVQSRQPPPCRPSPRFRGCRPRLSSRRQVPRRPAACLRGWHCCRSRGASSPLFRTAAVRAARPALPTETGTHRAPARPPIFTPPPAGPAPQPVPEPSPVWVFVVGALCWARCAF